LPSYDFNLFLNGVTQMVNGQPLDGLINAIGYPIAADVGLLPLTGRFGIGRPRRGGGYDRDRDAVSESLSE
jgi:hypothetical protein